MNLGRHRIFPKYFQPQPKPSLGEQIRKWQTITSHVHLYNYQYWANLEAKSTWEKYGAFLNSFNPKFNRKREWIKDRIVRHEVSLLFHQTCVKEDIHICLVSFFVQWYINLRGLLNAKAILLEEQKWHHLTHSWEDKRVNTFPKGIRSKVHVIAWLYIYIYIYIHTRWSFNRYGGFFDKKKKSGIFFHEHKLYIV